MWVLDKAFWDIEYLGERRTLLLVLQLLTNQKWLEVAMDTIKFMKVTPAVRNFGFHLCYTIWHINRMLDEYERETRNTSV